MACFAIKRDVKRSFKLCTVPSMGPASLSLCRRDDEGGSPLRRRGWPRTREFGLTKPFCSLLVKPRSKFFTINRHLASRSRPTSSFPSIKIQITDNLGQVTREMRGEDAEKAFSSRSLRVHPLRAYFATNREIFRDKRHAPEYVHATRTVLKVPSD